MPDAVVTVYYTMNKQATLVVVKHCNAWTIEVS